MFVGWYAIQNGRCSVSEDDVYTLSPIDVKLVESASNLFINSSNNNNSHQLVGDGAYQEESEIATAAVQHSFDEEEDELETRAPFIPMSTSLPIFDYAQVMMEADLDHYQVTAPPMNSPIVP